MTTSRWQQWLARTSPAYDFAALFILGLVLMAAGLGLRDPWPADEPRFALIARDMAHGSGWLIPTVAGEWYADKPPLFMWAIAAFYRLTDNLRIAFLLPSLIAGFGTVFLTYDLARRLWNREIALTAGVLLLLCVQLTLQARTAQIDALLTFWTTLGMYGLARHLLLGPQWRWYASGAFAAGLGIITKGVGFLPALMFLPWGVVRWRWPSSLPRLHGSLARWMSGPAMLVLAVALWGLPMLWWVATSAAEGLDAYRHNILLHQTADRYFDAWHHHNPFWYYIVEVIPWAWMPLSLMLPWLVPAWWRKMRAGDCATWLLLGWVVCVLIFFSLSPGKRGVYILPALPAAVLAAAPFVPELLRRRGVQRVFLLTVAAIAGAILLLLVWLLLMKPERMAAFAEANDLSAGTLYAVIAVLGGAAFIFAAAARRISGAAALALFLVTFWQIYGWWVAPVLNPSRSGAELMARVEAALAPSTELGMVGWKEQLMLHVQRPLVHFGFRRDPDEELRDATAWLSAAPNRRLLVPRAQMKPCLNPDLAEPMAFRHGQEWLLLGPDAITGQCDITARPQHIRDYDPRHIMTERRALE
ncbi:MAG: glycosyltransferase family 39 protein [Chromatiales bacterium]|nr:glycosyltransferase family 39 protein [Chromatiales bacterium]